MKNKLVMICLSLGGLLALNTGFGKPENAAPTSNEADTATRAAQAEPTQRAEKVAIPPTNAAATLASLSQDQMVQGLKDALAKGLQQAIARLGNEGGFLTNLTVKIPMPEKSRSAKIPWHERPIRSERFSEP